MNLMQNVYEQENISMKWNDGVIVPIYKEK